MKTIKHFILIFSILLISGACDDQFVEINTNPFAITELDDLSIVFAGSQRVGLGGWGTENTIVQHFQNPYNEGATTGFNFNENIDGQQNGQFGNFTGSFRIFVHILNEIKDDTDKENLRSIVRIWKAYVMMGIVDAYGDIPYSEAALAAIVGPDAFYPAYDNDETIYTDLRNELKDAISKLSTSGDFVSGDLFYGANGSNASNSAAEQVPKWQKLGNSILLRLGMRYSKINPTLASTIVGEAVNGPGGVMTSNGDNAFVTYDGANFTSPGAGGLLQNSRFYYAGEPLVDQLQATNDPRGKYIVAYYDNPNDPLGDPDPDFDLANQFGCPIGVETLDLPRGIRGGGYDYSQISVHVVASQLAPSFWMTYAQTSLLMAEAAFRGWGGLSAANAQTYYENAIAADMDLYDMYLSETGSSLPEVSAAELAAYLADPGVAYNATDALELINTQYWLVCLKNSTEAWANFRRSGFPALSPNPFGGGLPGDGFVHRFTYPDSEFSENQVNYTAAVAAIGGSDDLTTRVFWDN